MSLISMSFHRSKDRIMNSRAKCILTGRKDICSFVGRSWSTIRMWIDERGFPARKLDGIWESDAELIIQWRQRQIGRQPKNKTSETLGLSLRKSCVP
jgi:hypothetical protein